MEQKMIYALGFFDGVHRGHQALLEECDRLAHRYGCGRAAITFDAHPQSLFTQTPPMLINSVSDREKLLKEHRIDHVRILPVTPAVMGQPWRLFLEELVSDGAAGFVCGDDFRFGHRGQGNAKKIHAFCDEKGLPCVIVPEQSLDGVRISSTHIRKLIEQGDMENARRFLGHPHRLSGTVISGRHLGRTIGVPTANLCIPQGVVMPELGVYACLCRVDGQNYMAVTNIGNRPTVEGHQVRAESWILDFDGDLYGKELTLEFYKFLRPERKFPSLEELRSEIQKNADETRKYFENL